MTRDEQIDEFTRLIYGPANPGRLRTILELLLPPPGDPDGYVKREHYLADLQAVEQMNVEMIAALEKIRDAEPWDQHEVVKIAVKTLKSVRKGSRGRQDRGQDFEVGEEGMISAKIVLDSIGPNDARITTFELRYPRFIHAELMTHRMFSRNSASSRAIPTEKLLHQIESDPAMPVWWGKNQSGMQAQEELTGDEKITARKHWLDARSDAVSYARVLNANGLHKQIANRVVEPWMYITVLVTATEFANMRALRDHSDAQPEFRDVTVKMFNAFDTSEPAKLESGWWHLPLVTGNDLGTLTGEYSEIDICKISVGRCARVSYLTHDGKRDPAEDIKLAERLHVGGHMSPFEHVARAMSSVEWIDYSNELCRAWMHDRVPTGNLWGWKQLRKILANEHDFSKGLP